MILIRTLYVSLLAICFISCYSLKSKQRLVVNGINELKKYDTMFKVYDLYTIYNPNDTITSRKSMRQLKKELRQLKNYAALIPDSTHSEKGIIDSIYFNENKIKYIKGNHLVSLRMKFIKS